MRGLNTLLGIALWHICRKEVSTLFEAFMPCTGQSGLPALYNEDAATAH
jgi:hypothetical protein